MHLGIDFGTCFTSAAVLTGNQFRFVHDMGGGNSQSAYPSAVYFTADGELLLGMLAKNMARRDPSRFRHEFKRELGSSTPFSLGDQEFLPQDLIARLLHQLKAEAEKRYDAIFPAAVLTVPASYDAYRRDLMLQAGIKAGFRADGLVLLDEPEAAALAYDWQLKQQGKAIPEGAIVLVYDLGGGTFDAALMRKEGEKFRSLAPPVGDAHCGGIDFDRAIYQEIIAVGGAELQELLTSENMSVSALRKKLQMAELCRDVKHQLTLRSQHEDVLPEPSLEDFLLTRATFNAKIAPYIERTIELCKELVSASDITWDQVSGLLLIGGSSRIPYVSTRLSEAFHRPLWQVEDPQMAVCMGAAIRTGHRRVLKSVSLERTVRTNPVLAAGRGTAIALWDSSTGELIRTLPGHAGNICALALSPNGRLLANGSADNTIRFLDALTGKLIRTLTGHSEPVNAVAFSPDGTTLASASKDTTVKFWDTGTGKLRHNLAAHSYPVTSVAFRPDGKVLASGSDDNTIMLWDTAIGERTHTISAHRGQVEAIAFSPDGKVLVSSGRDKTVKFWDGFTGQQIHALTGLDRDVDFVAFSPDGKMLACCDDYYSITLWDSAGRQRLHVLSGHTGRNRGVVFSPDGKTLINSGDDETIKFWDVTTGKNIRTLPNAANGVPSWDYTAPLACSSERLNSPDGHSGRVRSLRGRYDGQMLVSGSDDQTVKIWNAETGEVVANLGGENGKIACADFAGPDSSLVVGDSTLGFWDPASQQRTDPAFGPTHRISAVAGSPNGKLVVTASGEALLCLWDAVTHEPIHAFIGHKAKIHSVVFSPDSSLIVSGSEDGTLKAWSVAELRILTTLTENEGGVCSIALSPDGTTLASSGKDQTVRLWDVATWKPIHSMIAHTDTVNSVAFSSDGSTLVSAGADKTIRVWNVATGELLNTLEGHEEAINAVLFALNDTRLVSGSDDRSVRFWKLDWA